MLHDENGAFFIPEPLEDFEGECFLLTVEVLAGFIEKIGFSGSAGVDQKLQELRLSSGKIRDRPIGLLVKPAPRPEFLKKILIQPRSLFHERLKPPQTSVKEVLKVLLLTKNGVPRKFPSEVTEEGGFSDAVFPRENQELPGKKTQVELTAKVGKKKVAKV